MLLGQKNEGVLLSPSNEVKEKRKKMKTYPLILAAIGFAPSRIITKNDTQIGAKLIKYDDSKHELVCELNKVLDSEDLIIEIVASDQIWQYRCHLTGPRKNTKTIIKIDDLKTRPSELTRIATSSALAIKNSLDFSISRGDNEEALPVAFGIDLISESHLYLDTGDNKLDDELKLGGKLELTKNGNIVGETSIVSAESWGSNHIRVKVEPLSTDVVDWLAETGEVAQQQISDKWDLMIKNGALVL